MAGTVPPVPQIPAGWGPLPADFDLWVTTPVGFLRSRPAFGAHQAAAQPLTAEAFTLCRLDTVDFDSYAGWSSAETADQPAWSWLCPEGCSGWYEVSMTAMTKEQGTDATTVGAQLFVSGQQWNVGSLSWGVAANTCGSSGAVCIPLAGGYDYLQLYIWSVEAVQTPATEGRWPSMEAVWVSS